MQHHLVVMINTQFQCPYSYIYFTHMHTSLYTQASWVTMGQQLMPHAKTMFSWCTLVVHNVGPLVVTYEIKQDSTSGHSVMNLKCHILSVKTLCAGSEQLARIQLLLDPSLAKN